MALSQFRTAKSRQVTTNADLREQIIETFKEKNYNPIKEMIELATNLSNPPEVRAALHRELAQYVFPKVRPVQSIEEGGAKGQGAGRQIQIVKFGDDAVSKAMDLDGSRPVEELVKANVPSVRMEAQLAVIEYGIDPDESVVVDVEATEVETSE